MAHKALADHRPWLLLSLLAAVTYFFVMDDEIGGAWLMIWKGAGVGLLSVYAAARGRGTDGLLIAAVMAIAACADVALEISFLIGGGLFALSHLVAIAMYLRNRRAKTSISQRLAGLALVVLPAVIAAGMTRPLPNWELATAYSGLVGLMAAAAWTSRFPRYRVGIGAVMFVVSDLMIFARESQTLPGELTEWFVWPLYYAAQFLIVTGVVQTLRSRRS
ncbi:lysoplasmalogenase [Qipengyuania sp. XHP0211]|uniref:lysoplasmalogenase n=1 Tax=Qipengyuania sp. XHP0211 TaxID=3038079 RepID=UPI00241ED03F|nr:lysoplasmalogenase [Qipengyuania sp. XHP0211]MDG5751225.1 lysoplasmalogenase [Qipengyuania sp. XHP0211]